MFFSKTAANGVKAATLLFFSISSYASEPINPFMKPSARAVVPIINAISKVDTCTAATTTMPGAGELAGLNVGEIKDLPINTEEVYKGSINGKDVYFNPEKSTYSFKKIVKKDSK